MTSRAAEASASARAGGDQGSPQRRRRGARSSSPLSLHSASPGLGGGGMARACALCGLEARDTAGAADSATMSCDTCANVFHVKCANLPAPPETGRVFCRHACYRAFLARRQAPERGGARSDSFPELAAGIHRVLQQRPAPPPPQEEEEEAPPRGANTGKQLGGGGARESKPDPAPSPPRWADGARSTMAWVGGEPGPSSRAGPPAREALGHGGNGAGHFPRSRSNSSSGGSRDARREARPVARPTREEYGASVPLPPMPGVLPGSLPAPPLDRRAFSAGPQPTGRGLAPHEPPSALPTLFDRRDLRAPQWTKAEPRAAFDRGGSAFALAGEGGAELPYQGPQRDDKPARMGSGNYDMNDAGAYGGRAPVRPMTAPMHGASLAPPPLGSAAAPPAARSVPWLNPSAFPADILTRFSCLADNPNRVFRIDLTPVFADKTTRLYQPEIDFFFRCFESPDVSLAVKGMASELTQYLWAWPFILQSCGSDTLFTFDHFQLQRSPADGSPELAYVGELKLSMASFNSYLERYLSSVPGKDVVVLEDHGTKKPVTIVASENVIALNDLMLAKHCSQLYSDLIKGFQWDVFAGGIHCLLQYLPQSCRHERFTSPLLHFNFPGARGQLCDPGSGTTDTAYQVLVGCMELVIFDRFEAQAREDFHHILQRAGYSAERKTMLLDSHLRALRSAGFTFSTIVLQDGEFVHVNKGRYHFWRVVEKDSSGGAVTNAPCVFLSWEWVFQGVSQRGISTECWFAMKNASLCTSGWAFDPRRAIVEAAKCGLAVVRTGEFLRSASAHAPPNASQLLVFAPAAAARSPSDAVVVAQRQEQMVLFLESILPCLHALVEEEYDLSLGRDDSDEFRKFFDDETMWKLVDTELSAAAPPQHRDYACGICGLELTNIYKQCLGCTVYARRARPNMAYPVFRICLRCHAQPEQHHFKPRALFAFFDKVLSSEGHTGLLPATRRYQSVRSYFKCRCQPSVRCAHCGGCESCSCLCHTLFQTRFRFTTPGNLDRLRADVEGAVRWHQQQLQQQP